MTTVAVLGTGIMGGATARNLLAAGHQVRVWNRTRARAEPLADAGATLHGTAAEAVAGAGAVVTVLADGPVVAEAMTGASGALAALGEGAVWIQMSTIGADETEDFVERAAGREVVFVDAPVLGSRAQAESGELVVLASGPDEARRRCEELLAAVARRVLWLGPAGAGTRLKLVANHWALCSIEAIAETVAFAEALDVDPRRFLQAIEGLSMDMPYVHLKGAAMLERRFDPAFPLRLARKDLGLILRAAGGKVQLPLASATATQFERAIALGHGDEDLGATYYASAADREERVRQ